MKEKTTFIKPRVLIINNDPGILNFFEKLLVDRYSISIAMDEGAAARAVQAGGYNLVFLDMGLPGVENCLSEIKKSIPDAVIIEMDGSRIKNVCSNYSGNEMGSSILNIPINEALVFDGEHYSKINIPYLKEFDTKLKNVGICVPKNVEKR